ncbi:MAG TPA: FkbM family methyltransferase [Nocardioidaceae bacterium]|nr:FkbM family methyltransferase [Nocardioidaceae bacterium]
MTIRSRAERLSHHLVLRRRLPAPYGGSRFYTSPEAGLRYLKPSLRGADPTLVSMVTELVRPGHVVWDIGANIGLFAFAAAARAGRDGHVICVEADTWNVALLRRSAASQPPSSAKVEVVPAAVSSVVGLAAFEIARRNRSTNALAGMASSQAGGVRETQIVPTLTLDLLAEHLPAPHFLKIDVEGAEALALEGAGAVLDSRPTVLCEVSELNAPAVHAMLCATRGYELFDADAPVPRRPLGSARAFNLLATPRTQLDAGAGGQAS